MAPAQPVRQRAGHRRGGDAEHIDGEDQADLTLIEAEGRRHQPEAGVIIQTHERAHAEEADGQQRPQRRVAQVPQPGLKVIGRIEAGPRREPARRRRQGDEPERGRQTEQAQRGQRHAPGKALRQNAGQHAPDHAAEGVAADQQAGGQAEPARIDLLGQIGHRHRRHAAHQEPGQGAGGEQADPAGHESAGHGQKGRGQHRDEDHLAPAESFRQDGGAQDGAGQTEGGERQRQRAFRRAHPEINGEHRQQRLRAIEQREGRETGQEQRDADAPIGRGPRHDRVGQGRRCRHDGQLSRPFASKRPIYIEDDCDMFWR